MCKVLIVNSSCRPKSNSSILSSHLAEGAKEAGHTVETIEIGALQIAPCHGCSACMKTESNFCVIKDAMHQFYPQIAQADVLIFSSPIYWFNVGGQVKQFIDRCYAVAFSPKLNQPFARKKIGAVFAYGDAEPLDAGCANAVYSFKDICAYTGAKWLGAVYGSAYDEGEFLKNKELLACAKNFGKAI